MIDMKTKIPFATVKPEGRAWCVLDLHGNILSARFLKPQAMKACKAINAAAEEWFEKRAAARDRGKKWCVTRSMIRKARRSK